MMISAQEIRKSFAEDRGRQGPEVLGGITLDIAHQEFVVILGPSGCGKSTFLKIMGGILAATSGAITLDGTSCGLEVPQKMRKQFGFIFQNNNLLPWRTAAGNLRFVLETMGLKGEPWRNRVTKMLAIVGLQDYMDNYPHELSGGMRQRVGIARALVHDPQVLLMDQPMGALDAITRRMLTFEIHRIWQKAQKTVLMVTNNVDEALVLANRVLILSPSPARITAELQVDIPMEEREEDILTDSRFLTLRAELNSMVRTVMTQEVST